jgi:hypothetical protein
LTFSRQAEVKLDARSSGLPDFAASRHTFPDNQIAWVDAVIDALL